MNPEIASFLELVNASQLVPGAALAAFAAGEPASLSAATKGLIEQRLITPWQMRVLESGESGPFFFGNYVLMDRPETGPLAGCYVARHIPSAHLVLLEFHDDSDSSPHAPWEDISTSARKITQAHSPYLMEVFEAVSLPEYSLVASELPVGKPLDLALPAGKKIPIRMAASIVSQVAAALESLHSAGTLCGNLSPANVWMVDKQTARLRCSPLISSFDPDLKNTNNALAEPGPVSDIFSLGQLMFRLLTGNEVPENETELAANSPSRERLVAEKVPAAVIGLIEKMMSSDPAARPDPSYVSKKLPRSAESDPGSPANEPESLQKLRDSILRFQPGANLRSLTELSIGQNPQVATDSLVRPAVSADGALSFTRRRKKSRFWPIAISGVALLALVGVGLTMIMPRDEVPVVADNGKTNPTEPMVEVPVDDSNNADANQASSPDESVVVPVIAQKIVTDDGSMLWESPTSGPRLNLKWLPPAPRIVVAVRCAELFGSEEGQRMISGGGVGIAHTISGLEQITGLKPEEVSQLVIGFYIGDNPYEYESFYVARLNTPAQMNQLESALGLQAIPVGSDNAEPEQPASPNGIFRLNDLTVYGVPEADTSGEKISTLIYGSADQIDSMIASGGQTAVDGPLAKLSSMADDSRLINVLIIPAALFNDAGQKLTAGPWSPLTNRLRTLKDDSLRAALLSMHIDGDCYLELMLEHAVDLRPDAARELLDNQLRQLRTEASESIALVPSNPWWDRVRLQMDNMINEFYRQTRTGVENNCVVANCWLPLVAPHNLVASGEIAFSASGGFSGESVPSAIPQGPQTLEQLLLVTRDLEITTNPDLGLLLQGLATEVNDQNRGLPFDFRIRMEGNDLLKQGITQNQRPGNFSLQGQSLADILTEIMFRANSNKTAAGPNDPLCELVWVIADDPDQAGHKMVLVTTRTAVAERDLTLPPQFRVDSESGEQN